MCRPTTCRSCSKTTWAGCGNHVDQVMSGVPHHQRCDCEPAERRAGGIMGRLLGR